MDKNKAQKKLIFVYNADSGLFNTVSDIAHKIISPSTYSCQLCALTHSYFSVKEDWQDFLKTINIPMEFLHKDEYKAKYKNHEINFPALLSAEDDELALLINADALNQCNSLDELKTLITEVCHSVQGFESASE